MVRDLPTKPISAPCYVSNARLYIIICPRVVMEGLQINCSVQIVNLSYNDIKDEGGLGNGGRDT